MSVITRPTASEQASALYDKLLASVVYLQSVDSPFHGGLASLMADAMRPVINVMEKAREDSNDAPPLEAETVLVMAADMLDGRARFGAADPEGAAFYDSALLGSLEIMLTRGQELLAH